jgi:proteic killer suppression protein
VVVLYVFPVIVSFRSRALKLFAAKGDAKRLPVPQADRVRRLLALLDAAATPRDMDQPGLMFHALNGGRYSVRVTANYRLTFGWKGADAVDVDLEDYH